MIRKKGIIHILRLINRGDKKEIKICTCLDRLVIFSLME